MNDDIFDEWEEDAKIDRTQLDTESLDIPKVHAKYLKMYHNERWKLKQAKSDLAKLRLEKFEFYTQGPNATTKERGWKYPGGRILKGDINIYMEGDPELVDIHLNIGLIEERVQILDNIIRNINNRGFQIKNAIDYLRWTNGQL